MTHRLIRTFHVVLWVPLLISPDRSALGDGQVWLEKHPTINFADVGTCDGCYCVPDNINNKTCPSEKKPPTEFPNDLIVKFKQLQWENPLTLSCDPYRRPRCDTNEFSISQTGVDISCCVIDFSSNGTSYTTRTYNGTVKEAIAEGFYVTHDGSCGLCSNLEDLAVYMETFSTLKEKASRCGFIGLAGKAAGKRCLQRIGFTKGCSTIWFYNTRKTRSDCPQCFRDVISGNLPNGPPPRCDLNACIQCDETKSGPIFRTFAGRIRRNSGLLTDIVRNCSETQPITHLYPP